MKTKLTCREINAFMEKHAYKSELVMVPRMSGGGKKVPMVCVKEKGTLMTPLAVSSNFGQTIKALDTMDIGWAVSKNPDDDTYRVMVWSTEDAMAEWQDQIVETRGCIAKTMCLIALKLKGEEI